jgi:methionyl-tRNA formyltransferase
MKPTVLFLGTPHFAVPILEELQKHFEIVGVVTQPDRPVGRKLVLTPPPVKIKAEELGLKVYQPEKASEIPNLIQGEFDFLVTAAYGEYLPTAVLQLAKKDSLNVHPSLLPKYRGATPMQSALLNGDDKTGVSIIRMAKQMDAGEIFAQSELEVSPEIKYPELEKECSEIGAQLITEVLQKYDQITPVDQDPSQVTHCHKITKEDGLIHWEKESAHQIFNKLRAFTPWPGIYTFFKNQKLSLLEFSPTNPTDPTNPTPLPPGTIFENEKKTFIQTKEDAIELKTLQLAGKKPTDIKSFLNGHPDFLGTKL